VGFDGQGWWALMVKLAGFDGQGWWALMVKLVGFDGHLVLHFFCKARVFALQKLCSCCY